MFILYLIILGYLLFVRGFDFEVSNYISYNLRFFATIKRYVFLLNSGNLYEFFINIIGNIIVFMPLGFFIPQINRKLDKTVMMIFLSLMIPVVIEAAQYVLKVGILDVDDVLLNFIGIMAGFLIYRGVTHEKQ
ncbi:MAG: VanZ family protein [Clostridia bacterium]|nr:VanZ family protein [Clostridia bacterium]